MNDLMLNTNMVDARGVTRDLSEDECLELAGQIGTVREIVDLAAGDVLNQYCRIKGLPPLTKLSETTSKATREKTSHTVWELSPLIESMGYSASYAALVAGLARAFPLADRAAGLGVKHYLAVQGMADRPQAIAILKEAQMGYRKANGQWVKPHPATWVKKRRRALEGDAGTGAKLKIEQNTHEVASDVVPEVERALLKSGLSARKAKNEARKVEREILKTRKQLENEFFKAVQDEAAKKAKVKMADAAKLAKESEEKIERFTALTDGVQRPITEAEYKILRQFCHPDKHPGNEAKAGQAYEIVCAIGERLQFIRKAG